MQVLQNMYEKIPGPLRSRYALVVYAFLIWLLFFDAFNLLYRWELYQELQQARQQKHFYQSEMKEIRADLNALMTDTSTLERFAREKYLMKRPSEDLFVIVPEEQ